MADNGSDHSEYEPSEESPVRIQSNTFHLRDLIADAAAASASRGMKCLL